MIENIENLSLEEKKKEIHKILRNKIRVLVSRIDCTPEHNMSEILDEEECPLDMPEQLVHEFHEFLCPLYLEIKGADARLEELTDSWLKYAAWADRYKEDAEYAYEDAERRTFWEKLSRSNHEDILLYKQAQARLAQYMLRAMAKDFLEDAVGDDTFLP